MKKNLKELQTIYVEKDFLSSFKKLFSLSHFFRNSVIVNADFINLKTSSNIALTEHGQALFSKLKERFPRVEDYKILFSIFLEFYHEELFIDVKKTNEIELRKLLNELIINGSIKFPWIFGRLLYDKYYDEFEGHDEILINSEALRLLKDTPQGVFQLGNLIVGPFGIIETNAERYIPPTNRVKLWHCADPSCTAFHAVELKDIQTSIDELQQEIKNILSEVQESDWGRFYLELIEPAKYFYDFDRLSEVPALLINAFGNTELKLLLKELIETDKPLRSKFPNVKKLKNSAQSIFDNIDKDECFQLLLLENDATIVSALEKLIEDKAIIIPSTEIRSSNLNLHGGFYDIYHQCNNLGIRSVSAQSNRCINRLVNVIEEVHNDPHSKEDLVWKLMEYKKDSFKETIENFVLQEEPRKIIRDTLLYGPRQTQKVIQAMYGNFNVPTNEKEKEHLINKLLWKLGFDVNIYPPLLNSFWEKLDLLNTVTQKCSENFTEAEKEELRSAAVNFFVLLEEVLEHSLSFVTWSLLSDHYLETKFRYVFEDARDFMCKQLNGQKVGSSEPLRFDSSGNNTLFPLVEGFVALINICDKYLKKGAKKYQKAENEIPHFHQKTELTVFPFVSKLLLFDIKQDQYEEIKSILVDFHKEFAKNKVLWVRNKLEHKERNTFPSKIEILNACSCIANCFKKFEETGIYPNVFLFNNSTIDKYNRKSYELEDYKGRRTVIKPITRFEGKLPGFKSPQVISSIITIGNSNELLRFKYNEASGYLTFWKNFPRKKSSKAKINIETGDKSQKADKPSILEKEVLLTQSPNIPVS